MNHAYPRKLGVTLVGLMHMFHSERPGSGYIAERAPPIHSLAKGVGLAACMIELG